MVPNPDSQRVAIIGASGYTGAELLRLCAQHPSFSLGYATGDTQAGTLASSLYPSITAAYPDLVFEEFDAARVDGYDAVFLGLPHEASMALVRCVPPTWRANMALRWRRCYKSSRHLTQRAS